MKKHDQDREKDRQEEILPGLLNEGSRRGGLGQGDGFELVCGSLGGVLALLRTMSLDSFGQSHRHHVGRCSGVHPREEAEREE